MHSVKVLPSSGEVHPAVAVHCDGSCTARPHVHEARDVRIHDRRGGIRRKFESSSQVVDLQRQWIIGLLGGGHIIDFERLYALPEGRLSQPAGRGGVLSRS